MPEILSYPTTTRNQIQPYSNIGRIPPPPPGPRSVACILNDIDGWPAMLPFKKLVHRLVRAHETQTGRAVTPGAVHNLALLGGSGVGKTTAALRYAELLASLRITNGRLVRTSLDLPNVDLAASMPRLCAEAAGGVWLVDNGHRFLMEHDVQAIFAAIEEATHPPVLLFCMDISDALLAEQYPASQWLFSRQNQLTLRPMSAQQTTSMLARDAAARGFQIHPKTLRSLRRRKQPSNFYQERMMLNGAVFEHASRPAVRSCPLLDSRDFLSAWLAPPVPAPPSPPAAPPPAKYPHVAGQTVIRKFEMADLKDLLDDSSTETGPFVASKSSGARPATKARALPASAAQCEALAKLEALEGLEHVKQAMRDVLAKALVGHARQQRGLSVEPQVLHAEFTGNPGTGKTTVARLYGELLCELGLLGPLGDGKVYEVDRTGLVGKYIGQTEDRVIALLEKAKGGVVFIDEAHGLVTNEAPDDKDFGRIALDVIIKFMEDHRHEIAIVFAGYAGPMERLHRANPGLRRRLGPQLTFPDFDVPALTRILQGELRRREYTLDALAAKRVCSKLVELNKRDESFGNAGSVRQMLESAIMVQSQRLSKDLGPDTARETMMQLLEADFFARDDGQSKKKDEPWRSMFS